MAHRRIRMILSPLPPLSLSLSHALFSVLALLLIYVAAVSLLLLFDCDFRVVVYHREISIVVSKGIVI